MPFLAALLPAVIGAGASLVGGLVAKSGADSAARKVEAASKRAEGMVQPFADSGARALSPLEAAYGIGDQNTLGARRAELTTNFESSPLYRYTYQPALDEATKAAERSGSAGGYLDSGRTIMAIQDRAARIGGQTFGNYLSGLEGIATRGQNAASGQASIAMNGGQQAANYATQGTNAMTAGILGVGSAAQQGFDNYNYLKGVSAYGPTAAFGGGR